MDFKTVQEFAKARPTLPGGIVAILLCESDRHADASARRLVAQGVGSIIAVGASETLGDPGVPVIRIEEAPHPKPLPVMLQTLLRALAGRWVLWLWNSEFLVFPFCETRRLNDLADFLGDERRLSIYGYTLDLYAKTLPAPADDPTGVNLYFDRLGYYAFPREGDFLQLRGGLGWRFEEYTPPTMQSIGRTIMLKPDAAISVTRDLTFGDTIYDTVNCPWHHNPTAAVMSLRRTRRIMAHPGFAGVADRLIWPGTTQFDWTSRQLLEIGMIEPGQWF